MLLTIIFGIVTCVCMGFVYYCSKQYVQTQGRNHMFLYAVGLWGLLAVSVCTLIPPVKDSIQYLLDLLYLYMQVIFLLTLTVGSVVLTAKMLQRWLHSGSTALPVLTTLVGTCVTTLLTVGLFAAWRSIP